METKNNSFFMEVYDNFEIFNFNYHILITNLFIFYFNELFLEFRDIINHSIFKEITYF